MASNNDFQKYIDFTTSPTFLPKERIPTLLDESDIALYCTFTNKLLIHLYTKSRENDVSYCSLVEPMLRGYSILEKERIENSLKFQCYRAEREHRKKAGSRRYKFEKDYVIIALKHDEVVCEKTYKQEKVLQDLRAETLLNELRTEKQKNEKLSGENQALKDYIARLQTANELKGNHGRKIGELERTQTYEKLKELKQKSEVALWFVETYGLKLDKLILEGKDDSSHVIDYTGTHGKCYKDLDGEQREDLKKLTALLDHYNISDGAYHELAIYYKDVLHRSYLIKECRDDVDSITHIIRTPGESPGAQVPLTEAINLLIKQEVTSDKENTNTNPSSSDDSNENVKVKVRIGCDGTKVSRNTNYIVLNISLLDEASHLNHHTLAIVEGKETYDVIKSSFRGIFDEINNQIDTYGNGQIPFVCESNSTSYFIEYFLCGDYKFLLLACGIQAANCEHACIYCLSSRKGRKNLQFDEHHWEQSKYRRKLDKIGKYNQVHEPLLHVDLDHIVIDELHLLLRVGGLLVRNIVMDAHDLDQQDTVLTNKKTRNHVDQLVTLIHSCGIPFQVWDTKDKKSGYDFTSLTGDQTKRILKSLPEKLQDATCITQACKENVISLWESFYVLYQKLSADVLTEAQIQSYFAEAKDWTIKYRELSHELEGFDTITPYVHIMMYHVPRILKQYGTLKSFSGQGLEKTNDDIKRIYHAKTNKHDAPAASLTVRRRKLVLKHKARIKNPYTKRNQQFWSYGKQRLAMAIKRKYISR